MGCACLKDFGLGRAKMYKDVFGKHQAFYQDTEQLIHNYLRSITFTIALRKPSHKQCKLILLMLVHVLHISCKPYKLAWLVECK